METETVEIFWNDERLGTCEVTLVNKHNGEILLTMVPASLFETLSQPPQGLILKTADKS